MDDEAQKLSDMEYHKQRLARERDLARKVGAVEFMAQHVAPIFAAAFQPFESRGAWPDPVEYEIEGIQTNLPLLSHVLKSAPFVAGRYTTGILKEIPKVARPELTPQAEDLARVLAALAGGHPARAGAEPGRAAGPVPRRDNGNPKAELWEKALVKKELNMIVMYLK